MIVALVQMVELMTLIAHIVQVRVAEYNNIRGQLNAINRKQSGRWRFVFPSYLYYKNKQEIEGSFAKKKMELCFLIYLNFAWNMFYYVNILE